AFRDLETAVITDLMQRDEQVIALGGGAILRPENRAVIQANSYTVWLTADVETILARISADAANAAQRPSLTAATPLEEVAQLLQVREPLYRDTADVVVDTQHQTPEEVALEIYQFFAPLIE